MTIDARHLRKKVGGGIIADGDELALDETFGKLADISTSVLRTSSLTMADEVEYILDWDVEQFDTDGMVDLVSNASRVTIQRPGKYRINTSARLDNTSTASNHFFTIKLYVDGSQYAENTQTHLGLSRTCVEINRVIELTADQYLQVSLTQDSNAPHDISLDNGGSPVLTVVKID